MTYIDCDSHILPFDAFDEVALKFPAESPKIVCDENGNYAVVYAARQKNIPDYARHIPNPFNPRPRVPGDDPAIRVADMTASNFDMQVLVPNNGPFYYDVE
ncbi:MAG: hypothetical protein ACREO5_09970, partial [Candidatus Binatia bacterium]